MNKVVVGCVGSVSVHWWVAMRVLKWQSVHYDIVMPSAFFSWHHSIAHKYIWSAICVLTSQCTHPRRHLMPVSQRGSHQLLAW